MAILRLTAICGLKSSNGRTTPIPLDERAKLCPDTLLTIVIRYDQIVTWHSNDGSENFTANTISNTMLGPADIEVIDLDKDGDKDFVVGCVAGDEIVWFENNGSESFTQHDVATGVIISGKFLWLI